MSKSKEIINLLKKTIQENKNLNQNKKDDLNKQLNIVSSSTTTNSEDYASVIRKVVSNPSVNSGLVDIGFNPTEIMRDTYKPGYSFAPKDDTPNTNAQQQKPINKADLKNAIVIVKKQQVEINEKGKQEITHSTIKTIKPNKIYNDKNEKGIPYNQNQSFDYSAEELQLTSNVVNPKIPFSKKIKR